MKLAIAASAALFAASAAPAQQFDMMTFFTGKTRAQNVLKVAFKSPVPLTAESVGGMGDRGNFVLIDTVHEGNEPVRTRKWIIHEIGPGHYGGSLSDAVDPVDIVVSGNSATIRYTMKGGLKVVQQLQLQADGRTLSNHVDVRKFGMKFGTVQGTIRKLD